jgi:hypothetical protein
MISGRMGAVCDQVPGLPPYHFDADKNNGADYEIDDQAKIFAKERMPHCRRHVGHQQKINRIAGKHGDERVKEV